MATNKHYPILLAGQAGDLVDVDETGGVSQSVSEPVVQLSQGVPDPSRDPQGFRAWLKNEHNRLNGGRHG